jgi:hypothetical protein
MTAPPSRILEPDAAVKSIYDELYALYRESYDLFGRERRDLMQRLRSLAERSQGG